MSGTGRHVMAGSTAPTSKNRVRVANYGCSVHSVIRKKLAIRVDGALLEVIWVTDAKQKRTYPMGVHKSRNLGIIALPVQSMLR